MVHEYCAETDRIKIRPLHECDIGYLRNWRNDNELSRFLRDITFITPEMQLDWYHKYEMDNDTVFFTVIEKGTDKVVGSVAIYNFVGESCEVGKIVIGDASAHGKGIGYGSLILAMVVAIDKLGVKLIYLEVHEDNIAARTIYEKVGFKEIGRHKFSQVGDEIEMQITSDEFLARNDVSKIKIYEEDKMKTLSKNRGGGVLLK